MVSANDELFADEALAERPRKGRGALSNRSGRFEAYERRPIDDGWSFINREGGEGEPPPHEAPLPTTVALDKSRSVITGNESPDIPYDRSINPYRGCEHGCVYCYARPSHAYLGLSPGLDFETRIFAKPEAARLLEDELRGRGYLPRAIELGSNTDPYQPVERSLKITRGILETLAAFSHPVCVVTKSDLVCRDIDILAPMAKRGLACVAISVTTLDHALARRMEPRAAAPRKRIAAISALSAARIPVRVMAAPMIPALNDSELERILEAAAKAGAVGASYALLRLPCELGELFSEWLESHAPGRAGHVLSLVRQHREGNLNNTEFGKRLRGSGQFAELLNRRFRLACKRLGLEGKSIALKTSLFAPPPRRGDQLSLL